MSILKRFIDKAQALRVAKQAGTVRELASLKGKGEVNTYVPYKEQVRKKKRKQMAKASQRRNRK